MADVTAGVGATPSDATIHDIGYRRYEGALLGDAGSWRALFWQGFRALFGFGRSAKSKVVPVFVLVMTLLPALAMLTAASATQGMMKVQYAMLVGQQLILYVLFMAAQAPEILSRDQQQRVLPLILTRQITRNAYASARFAALALALFVIALSPPLLLYIGEIGSAVDPAVAFERMGGKIWPVLAHALVTALLMSGVGALLAALTPRRAYATAAIIGTFLVLAAIGSGIEDLTGGGSRVADFLDPLRSLRTQAMLLFEETNRRMELQPPTRLRNYLLYHVALTAGCVALLVLRIRRVRV